MTMNVITKISISGNDQNLMLSTHPISSSAIFSPPQIASSTINIAVTINTMISPDSQNFMISPQDIALIFYPP
jgi:hypothetical protein